MKEGKTIVVTAVATLVILLVAGFAGNQAPAQPSAESKAFVPTIADVEALRIPEEYWRLRLSLLESQVKWLNLQAQIRAANTAAQSPVPMPDVNTME